MDCRIADADAPDLGVGTAGQQALGGGQGIVRDLEDSAVHVEGHDPPAVAGVDLRAHVLIVESSATAGMLFFAVARLGSRHGCSPIWRGGTRASALYCKQEAQPLPCATPSRDVRTAHGP